MTKAELIKALEPYSDDMQVCHEYDGRGIIVDTIEPKYLDTQHENTWGVDAYPVTSKEYNSAALPVIFLS